MKITQKQFSIVSNRHLVHRFLPCRLIQSVGRPRVVFRVGDREFYKSYRRSIIYSPIAENNETFENLKFKKSIDKMPKIQKIYFKNFKGFEYGFLEFKALNFLIGANSSGKSSMLKLILLISQSMSTLRSALFQYKGALVDIGEKKNIFKNLEKKKELEFGFVYDGKIDFTITVDSCIRALRSRLRTDLRLINQVAGGNVDSKELNHAIQSTFNNDIDALMFAAKFINKNFAVLSDVAAVELIDTDFRVDYLGVHDALLICKELANLEVDRILYTVRNNFEKDSPEIVRIRLCNAEFEVLQLKFGSGKNLGVRVALSPFDQSRFSKYYSEIQDCVRFRSFQCVRKIKKDAMSATITRAFQEHPVGTLFAAILDKTSRPISNDLSIAKIRHVSPLRAYPKRYYLVDSDALDENVESDNESERIVKLFRENMELLANVNEWLAKLGHKIELDRIHESVYQILSANKSLRTDLTNVGFGLSQILPVIVEPLVSIEGDIVIIQQPEIHLHPKAQSILADYFIWVAKTKKITIFVETHSEYLLRRIRRRTAEGGRDSRAERSILPQSVSILSVEKSDFSCAVKSIEISENGAFAWPKDFLENEIDDLISYLEFSTPKKAMPEAVKVNGRG